MSEIIAAVALLGAVLTLALMVVAPAAYAQGLVALGSGPWSVLGLGAKSGLPVRAL